MARWLDLTRRQLPAMAAAQRWPIRLDHCFMRVCLDVAMGQPWYEVIRRPAVQHATLAQLGLALGVAERVMVEPEILPKLDQRSLAMRGKARKKAVLF